MHSTDRPARLDAHELVLLHGQPGSPADWQQVARLLPARLHAVAPDRPGYGSSGLPASGFVANARAVLDDLDSRAITRAVLVGHSYGGGVALSAASLAPGRVTAVVLLASVGPGCLTGLDRLLAAPGAGPLCAQLAWRLTPWVARVRLAGIARRRGRPLGPGEYVNWQVWGQAGLGQHPLWRTFLTEQRALLRELSALEHALPSVRVPVLVLADPKDTVVPFETARRLTCALPDARLQLVQGAGHHLPRRAPEAVADAIAAFLATAQNTDAPIAQPAATGVLVGELADREIPDTSATDRRQVRSEYCGLFQYHLPVRDVFRREKRLWGREISMSKRQPGAGSEQPPGLPRVLRYEDPSPERPVRRARRAAGQQDGRPARTAPLAAGPPPGPRERPARAGTRHRR